MRCSPFCQNACEEFPSIVQQDLKAKANANQHVMGEEVRQRSGWSQRPLRCSQDCKHQ